MVKTMSVDRLKVFCSKVSKILNLLSLMMVAPIIADQLLIHLMIVELGC